ncbi:unnamed protein product [Calypogeia fissa]
MYIAGTKLHRSSSRPVTLLEYGVVVESGGEGLIWAIGQQQQEEECRTTPPRHPPPPSFTFICKTWRIGCVDHRGDPTFIGPFRFNGESKQVGHLGGGSQRTNNLVARPSQDRAMS